MADHKRIRLDIETHAIEGMKQVLPTIYELRQPATPVKFSTYVTAKDDETVIGEVFGQQNKLQLPIFIIRRKSIAFAENGLNRTVMQREGYGRQRSLGGDIYRMNAVDVNIGLDVTLLTDDFSVLDHFLKVLTFYGHDRMSFASVRCQQPEFDFPVSGKFQDTLDYPPFAKIGEVYNGWQCTIDLQLFTHIVDLMYVPIIRKVNVEMSVMSGSQFAMQGEAFDPSLEDEVLTPNIEFVIADTLGEAR